MDCLNKHALMFLVVLSVFHVHADVIDCESSGNSIELQPYGDSCQQFLVCVQNVGTVIPCPNDSYFDKLNKECQDENPCEEPEDPECHPACADIGSGRIASNENCYDYVECDNCEAEFKSCSAGLHFNPIHGKCDSADLAECILDVCSFNKNGLWEIIASVNSCRKYYFCFGSEAILRNCGDGTVFDKETYQCVLETPESPCNDDRPPFPDASVIEQCTPLTEFKLIPDPEKEEFFYQCLNGILTVRRCPGDLVFDSEIMMCNVRPTPTK